MDTLKFRTVNGILLLLYGIFQCCEVKGQPTFPNELKIAHVTTWEISNVGLFYEIIPKSNFGYEIGAIKDKQLLYLPCDGYCNDPDQAFKAYQWKSWTFTLALKYYFTRKKDHSRLYLGAFLLYALDISGSLSDEFRGRLKKSEPFDFSYHVFTNRLSPGGLLGYKIKLGTHLLIEPSLGLGINVNSTRFETDWESFFAGKIAWRF